MWPYVFISPEYLCKSGISVLSGTSVLHLLRKTWFFAKATAVLHSHPQYMRVPVSPHQHLLLFVVLVTQSCLTLLTQWTVAHQAPLSMGFSRQEYWSGLPCPPPGDLPDPGIEPGFPALKADSLPTELWGKPLFVVLIMVLTCIFLIANAIDCSFVCLWRNVYLDLCPF